MDPRSGKHSEALVFDCERAICTQDAEEVNNVRKLGFVNDHVLRGHTAAVNCIDMNDTYIVSGSGDRTLR